MEFHSKGIIRHFVESITEKEDNEKTKAMIEEISKRPIPEKRYYISFTNCLISLKSHKYQFLRILDSLYTGVTQGKLKCSFEQAINNIVFGLPHPTQNFDYLWKQPPLDPPDIVRASLLTNDRHDVINFRAENQFDQVHSSYENIWVMINELDPELI